MSVQVKVVTSANYIGPEVLVLDRVPCEGEAINCYGGFLLVNNVVHVPKDDANPPSAVVKASFHPVNR